MKILTQKRGVQPPKNLGTEKMVISWMYDGGVRGEIQFDHILYNTSIYVYIYIYLIILQYMYNIYIYNWNMVIYIIYIYIYIEAMEGNLDTL